MADKYYITGDIRTSNTPSYGENRIEIGGSTEPLIVEVSESGVFDTKAGVVYDALTSGVNVYLLVGGINFTITRFAYTEDNGYLFSCITEQTNTCKTLNFYALTSDDYPEVPQG